MSTELVTATAMSVTAEVTVKAMLSTQQGDGNSTLLQERDSNSRQGPATAMATATATATVTAKATATAGVTAGVTATAAARGGNSFGNGDGGDNGGGNGNGDTVATMKAFLIVTLKAGANAMVGWVCSTAR